jgi:hypothetical protein
MEQWQRSQTEQFFFSFFGTVRQKNFQLNKEEKLRPSLDPEIRFAGYDKQIRPSKIFEFCYTRTEIIQAGAATQTADAAAEAPVAAAPLTAESGVEAAVRQHGTTLAEAPAADGGRTARRPVSTLQSPFDGNGGENG